MRMSSKRSRLPGLGLILLGMAQIWYVIEAFGGITSYFINGPANTQSKHPGADGFRLWLGVGVFQLVFVVFYLGLAISLVLWGFSLMRRGHPYEPFRKFRGARQATSAIVPFIAILRGRPRINRLARAEWRWQNAGESWTPFPRISWLYVFNANICMFLFATLILPYFFLLVNHFMGIFWAAAVTAYGIALYGPIVLRRVGRKRGEAAWLDAVARGMSDTKLPEKMQGISQLIIDNVSIALEPLRLGLGVFARKGPLDGPRRISSARRWARAREISSIAVCIGLLLGGAAVVTAVLWSIGWIHSNPPSGPGVNNLPPMPAQDRQLAAVVVIALIDQFWNLANAIPVINLTDTLHWSRPTLFAQDSVQSIWLFIVRFLIVIPLIAYVTRVFQDRKRPVRPEFSDPVVSAMVASLVNRKTRWLTIDTKQVLDDACNWLESHNIPAPAGSPEAGEGKAKWQPSKLASALQVALAKTQLTK